MITFDEAKRIANIKKHGIDFVGVEALFTGITITRDDNRHYTEQRKQTLGILDGIVVFVIHTDREHSDHIISIRKAEKHEERIYWKYAQ